MKRKITEMGKEEISCYWMQKDIKEFINELKAYEKRGATHLEIEYCYGYYESVKVYLKILKIEEK